MTEKMLALTCPYCGSAFEADEVYPDTGSIVISCANRECGAEWGSDGSPFTPARLPTAPRPTTVLLELSADDRVRVAGTEHSALGTSLAVGSGESREDVARERGLTVDQVDLLVALGKEASEWT